ncbi:hypothetical protein D9Q98_005904 [Chlorella vulgaris]|uniref:Fungal lipase-type domain-containing protein n=1 Tax=Chlorella vulgaris TaxID=3077 RepID=A0A9D4Z1D2_CHLVU|nr:hypothetical protein D9Q98_005904 [Chlorella vulgaris]
MAGQNGSSEAAAPAERQSRQRVVLRQEVATKLQARILTWSVIALNVLFVCFAVALFSVHNQSTITASEARSTYWGRLGIAVACQAALLWTGLWQVLAVRQSKREGRVWSHRQHYFAWTAGGLMCLHTAYAAFILASLSSTLAQPNCGYNWRVLAVLQFFQWTFFSASLFFVLARMKNLVLWRGPGALDMPPDYRLLMDRPYRDQARAHLAILSVWMLLEGAALFGMITRLKKLDTTSLPTYSCDLDLKALSCERSTSQIVSSALTFALVITMVLIWLHLVRRALADHEQLPFTHYRSTHMFIRVQSRVVSAVFTAIIFSLLFMSLVPTLQGNCVAAADSQVGNVAVDLSMTVAAVVLALLYMPKAQALDSPLLQEFLQDFSWTQQGIAAAVEARNKRLLQSEAVDSSAKASTEEAMTNLVGFLPAAAMAGVAKLTGVQDMAGAVQQLSREPMFCMETAIRLFYWVRLAYRQEQALDGEFVNAATALPLFGLDQHVTVWDDKTDTHCVLGWSASQVVLAFRGTASLQNAMTDIKAWKITLAPHRRVRGELVKAHAGFATAWLNNGFNEKVLGKLREVDAARTGSGPLRIWLTGHSLGGALAILAAVEIRRAFPDSQMSCYTFGCPRVGNAAFTAEQEEAVPDTWAILNGMDPIPWIPKLGFKRAGNRVSINVKGDLILRPTYFEVSVMQRGNNTKHHMTGSYALSLAAILKAQFVPSKAFPGGAEGVRQLAAAMDLGAALTLRHMEIAALEDQKQLPSLLELGTSKQPVDPSKRGRLAGCAGACGSWDCWPCGAAQELSKLDKEHGGGEGGGADANAAVNGQPILAREEVT